MQEFLDTLLVIYGKFVTFLFEFDLGGNISMGYLIVAIAIIGIVFFYFLGRLK